MRIMGIMGDDLVLLTARIKHGVDGNECIFISGGSNKTSVRYNDLPPAKSALLGKNRKIAASKQNRGGIRAKTSRTPLQGRIFIHTLPV
jgi:hypothetical protein